MGNKDNPRRTLRTKRIAGNIGVLLLLVGGLYTAHLVLQHLTEQEELLLEYQDRLVEQGSLIDQYKDTLSIQQGEISDFNMKVDKLNKQVDDLNTQVKTLDTQLENQKKDRKKAEDSYKREIEKLEQDLAIKKANQARERERALSTKYISVTRVAHANTDNSKKTTIVSRGSAPSGKTLTVSATAYTAFCNGCSGITATGINLRANPGLKVIAVDPRVIPLGSKVWVEGYGYAVAGDTGGAIKGNKIDLFIPDKQAAFKWGRKTIQIKIIQ